jgi:hypothetical protein
LQRLQQIKSRNLDAQRNFFFFQFISNSTIAEWHSIEIAITAQLTQNLPDSPITNPNIRTKTPPRWLLLSHQSQLTSKILRKKEEKQFIQIPRTRISSK